jgi:hypothetical protein
MARLFQFLAVLATLLLERLKGACPSYQKFTGSSVTKCLLANPGVRVPITCDVPITKYTMFAWVKVSLDDSIFSTGGALPDVYFSIVSEGDSMKRLELRFKMGTGNLELHRSSACRLGRRQYSSCSDRAYCGIYHHRS